MPEVNDDATRERILQLAFGGDERKLREFIEELRRAAPEGTTVILRGSVVTGTRWLDGQPFDADGPGTSDLDVTFLNRDMLEHFEAFYIPGLHSVPYSDEHPDAAPSLRRLRDSLCYIAGRPVNMQASSSLVQFLRDVVFDQPYFTLIQGSDEDADDEASAA